MMFRASLIVSVLAASVAHAQPKPPTAADASFDKDLDALFSAGGLTADEAAKRASKASPTVTRRAADVEIAIAQLQTAELARVPQVTAKATYTRLSPLDPFPLGPGLAIEFPVSSYVFNGQLGVPLSEYLVRFPKIIDAAKLGRDAAMTGQRAAEVNAGQDARLAYYEWLRAKLQVLVAERQFAQVQTVVKQMRALADAQRVSRADLMRVESNAATAEQVVNQLQRLAALREEQVRILIGAGNEPLSLGEDPRGDVAAPNEGELDALVGTAQKQRLEFRAIDLGIAAKEKQRESELANKLPRLSAFAQADYANPNQRVFPQVAEFRFTWLAGVQLSWTMNDALIARTTERRIAAEQSQLRADRENLLRGTRVEVLAAQQAVQLAQLNLKTSQQGLAAAEESYRVRRELLNAERATAVELVDAETELTRARITSVNARVDLRVAIAQLRHALGEDARR